MDAAGRRVRRAGRAALPAQHLKTLDEVLSALGTPNRDEPHGLRIARPAKDDQPPTYDTYRVLVYTELSLVADVRVTVYSTELVRINYHAKYVGLPNDQSCSRPGS